MVLFIDDNEESIDRLVALAASVSLFLETTAAYLSELIERSANYLTTIGSPMRQDVLMNWPWSESDAT